MTMKPSILHPSELVKRIRVHSDADAFEVQKLEFQLAEARSLVKVHEAFDIACSAPSSTPAIGATPRTDAAVFRTVNVSTSYGKPDTVVDLVDAELARQLERENAELLRQMADVMATATVKSASSVSAIAPKMETVYLIDGKPHRFCYCDTMKGDCPRGNERQLQTAQLSRCLVSVVQP